MCDVTFALGQRGGHFFQCPTKRDYTRVPKKLQKLLTSNQLSQVYHVAIGADKSFLITYRGTDGKDYIESQDLPAELNDFLYSTNSRNQPLRSIPNICLTLGPYNSSFFVGDGSAYLWMNLPPNLLSALQSRIQDGAWIDEPRIVALGADKNFLLVTENHSAVWDLPHYRTLSQMLEFSRTQDGGVEEVKNVVLHAYRYQGFIAQSRNGTLLAEGLPAWSMEGLEGMRGAVVRDTKEAEVRRQRDLQRRRSRGESRQRELQRLASFKREWDSKKGEIETRAQARGLKLSLNLNIGIGGVSFGNVLG